MRVLQHGVTLALAFAMRKSDALPETSIVSVASPNNFIIYEKNIQNDFATPPARTLKIQSNVPLTIQRYDKSTTAGETHPLNEGDGRVLVTSNCDTTETNMMPVVSIQKGDKGDTVVKVELDISTDDTSQMPFLKSSSYNATWYEPGCGWFRETIPPTSRPSEEIIMGGDVQLTTCLTEGDCDEMRQKMGIATFLAGSNYPSDGCFLKNGIAYWGSGGSMEDISKPVLPGVRERIWCEGVGDIVGSNDEPNGDLACMTQSQCDEKRLKMGIATLSAGTYPTKGCFMKNGNAYWGNGGTAGEISRPDLPGVQERIWCNDDGDSAGGECQVDPDGSENCGFVNQFCQLDAGVCNDKSGTHEGTCREMGEACIEIYQPVCGCDSLTYDNECKAHARGVNVARKGKCPKEDVPCLTEEDCDKKRQEIGIINYYSSPDYRTKGCFLKNGKAYFSLGSMAEMSEGELPGLRERLWCGDSESSKINSVLQQSDTDAFLQVQQDSATNDAFSLRSFAVTTLLHNAFSTRSEDAIPQTRALDTCSYNVEVLLAGCAGSGLTVDVEVAAPKARAINSEIENKEQETYSVDETQLPGGTQISKDYKNTATLTFPDGKALTIDFSDVSSLDFAALPSFDEDKCWDIVCGRPFVDYNGKSMLASSFSAGECVSASSWLHNVTQATAINSMTSQNMLEKEWTRSALGEHASVASFAAFSIALMSNSAPSNLVEDSLIAALDEVRHAKMSFNIASKLARKVIGPGSLPPSRHEFKHNLTALAVSVAKEGCVDETLSALAAAAECELIDQVLENGADAVTKYSGVAEELLVSIRNDLQIISLDESNHSALAWRTLNWLCTVDADACRAAKQNVLEESKLTLAFQHRFSHYSKTHPDLLGRMMTAWTTIHNNQKATGFDAEVDECSDRCSNEGNVNDLLGQPLISLLVRNILQAMQSV